MKNLVVSTALVLVLGPFGGQYERQDCVQWAQRHFDMTYQEAEQFCARVR